MPIGPGVMEMVYLLRARRVRATSVLSGAAGGSSAIRAFVSGRFESPNTERLGDRGASRRPRKAHVGAVLKS